MASISPLLKSTRTRNLVPPHVTYAHKNNAVIRNQTRPGRSNPNPVVLPTIKKRTITRLMLGFAAVKNHELLEIGFMQYIYQRI